MRIFISSSLNRESSFHGISPKGDTTFTSKRAGGKERLSPLGYPSSFRSIWPSSGTFGKTCLVRAHLWSVVVERFRRDAERRGAQAATQGLGLECQAGFDLFADHSLRFCSASAKHISANC